MTDPTDSPLAWMREAVRFDPNIMGNVAPELLALWEAAGDARDAIDSGPGVSSSGLNFALDALDAAVRKEMP